MRKDTAVLGLGNPLMADEGIGCLIVQQLLTQADKYPNVDFIDVGTGGISILHLIANRHKVILVDCAYMGEKQGTMKKFRPEDVKSIKKLAHQSLHEADIIKILALAKHLKQYPEQVIIFGIEPEKIEPGQNLSKTLKEKLDDYVAEISEELNLQSTEKIVINPKRPLKHSDKLDKKTGRNQS